MTNYEKPVMEIMEIKNEDIVCTSNPPGTLNPFPGNDGPWMGNGN